MRMKSLEHIFIKKICLITLLTCLLSSIFVELAYADHRNVLVLLSYHKGQSLTDNILSGIETVIKRSDNRELYVEYMDRKSNTPNHSFYYKYKIWIWLIFSIITILIFAIIILIKGLMKQKEADKIMKADKNELELRVQQRTTELKEMNDRLNHKIMECQQAESSLKKSEERFRAIFEQANDSIVLIDTETGGFTEFNEATHISLGYTHKEFRKLKVSDIEATESPEEVQKHIEKVVVEGSDVFETKHRTKTGEIRDVLVSIRTIEIDNKVFLIDIWRDITERKRMEEYLKTSLSLLNSTMESTADGLLVVGHDRKARLYNKPFTEMLRIPEDILSTNNDEKMIACVLDQLKAPDEFLDKLKELYNNPEMNSFDVLTFKDGRIFEGYSQPQKIDDQIVGRVWSFRDVSTKQQSIEYFKGLFEQSKSIMLLLDPDTGDIVDANEKSCSFYGYTKEELTAMKITDINTLPRDEVFKEMEKAWTERSEHFQFRHRLANGEMRDVEVYSGPVYRKGKKLLYSIIHDITERKRMEGELEKEAELQKAVSKVTEALLRSAIDIHETARIVHKQALQLTDSIHGYVSMIDEKTKDEVSLTITDMIDKECKVAKEKRQIVFPKGPEGYNALYGHSLNTLAGFYTNSPEDQEAFQNCTPAGHIPVKRFLAVPALITGRLIGQIALANSTRDYTDKDLNLIERLASVYAIAIDRKRIENRLREGQERLQLIMDNSTAPIYIKNEKGQYIMFSKDFESIFGIKNEEILYKTDYDIMPREPADRLTENDREVLEKGKSIRVEERIVHKDGITHTYLTVKFPLVDSSGAVRAVCGISTDISDRKRNEERLAKEAGMNEAMAELSTSILSGEYSFHELSDLVLGQALKLTESTHGIVAEVCQNTGDLIGHALTGIGNMDCKIAGKEQNITLPRGTRGYSALWGHALNTLESFYTNNPIKHESYKGCSPEGHISLDRYLSAPATIEGRLAGQIALANSSRDYNESDIETAEKLAVIYAIAIENKKAEKLLKYRSDMARLVSEISTRFVDIPVENIDSEIEKALKEMVTFISVDSGYIFRFSDDYKMFSMTHLWHTERVTTFKKELQNLEAATMPWWMEQLKQQKEVALNNLDNLPEEAAVEKRIIQSQGIKSIVDVPLNYQGRVTGFMGFSSAKTISQWSEDEINLLKITGQVFFNAIQRKKDEYKRRKAEITIRESERRFRSIFDLAPVGIALIDSSTGVFIKINKKYCQIVMYKEEEMLNKDFMNITHPDDLKEDLDNMEMLRKGEIDFFNMEKRYYRKDGAIVWVNLTVVPLWRAGEEPFSHIAIVDDITERKKMEEQIQGSLKEKELLLSEIHHRVKNNLAIVSSILSMQRTYITDEKHLELFRESESRIKSMALIHEKLYKSEDMARIDFRDYIQSLSNNLFNTYRTVGLGKVELRVDVKDVCLGIDMAVPCGLLINELITNALKYAFPQKRAGELYIGMHKEKDENIELIVQDNGIGIPGELDIKQTKTLGYQLITGVSESQLGGEIKVNREGGTKVTVTFRETEKRRRPFNEL